MSCLIGSFTVRFMKLPCIWTCLCPWLAVTLTLKTRRNVSWPLHRTPLLLVQICLWYSHQVWYYPCTGIHWPPEYTVPRHQVHHWGRRDDARTFLNTNTVREEDRLLKVTIYPTHICQYLDFPSNHQLDHKISVVRMLHHRPWMVIIKDDDWKINTDSVNRTWCPELWLPAMSIVPSGTGTTMNWLWQVEGHPGNASHTFFPSRDCLGTSGGPSEAMVLMLRHVQNHFEAAMLCSQGTSK